MGLKDEGKTDRFKVDPAFSNNQDLLLAENGHLDPAQVRREFNKSSIPLLLTSYRPWLGASNLAWFPRAQGQGVVCRPSIGMPWMMSRLSTLRSPKSTSLAAVHARAKAPSPCPWPSGLDRAGSSWPLPRPPMRKCISVF